MGIVLDKLQFHLSEFELGPEGDSIFISKDWVSGRDLLYNLERYGFQSTHAIVDLAKEKGWENVAPVGHYREITPEHPRYREFEDIRQDERLLVEWTEGNKVRVIAEMFDEDAERRATIKLPVSGVEVVKVTPRNFEVLRNRGEIPWDYKVLLKRIVLEAMQVSGRDIHLSTANYTEGTKYLLSYRVASDLEPSNCFQFTKEMNRDFVFNLIGRSTKSNEMDLDSENGVTTTIDDVFGDGNVTLRVAAMKVSSGYKCTMRIQQSKTTSLKIHELGEGFDEATQKDLKELAYKSHGLTLITGPINTGKNTTQFAIANEMEDMPNAKIDFSSPPEIRMPFDQVDYKDDIVKLEGLIRLSKKSDLDVVFMNEIPGSNIAFALRDLVHSSIHVITTTHISRVWHLPAKLKEFFKDEYKDIFFHLNACFTQKMFKCTCGHCDQYRVAVSSLPERYRNILQSFGIETILQDSGCEHCQGLMRKIRIRPYAERVIFSEELVLKLMQVERPYEMEIILKQHVKSQNHHLEYNVSKAIEAGHLPYTALKDLL